MPIVVFFVLVLVSIVLHEVGHALVFLRLGIPIKQAGIGIGPGIMVRPFGLKFPVKVSPLIIAAYVMPEPDEAERIEALSYRDTAMLAGAGVLANIFFAAVLLVAVSIVSMLTPGHHGSHDLILIAIALGVSALCWFGRYFFTQFLIVPIGIAFLVSIIVGLAHGTSGGVSGPIGLAKQLHGVGYVDAILWAADVSLSLAVLNMVPFAPLDGSRIFVYILRRINTKLANGWQYATTVLMLIAVVVIYGHDIFSR